MKKLFLASGVLCAFVLGVAAQNQKVTPAAVDKAQAGNAEQTITLDVNRVNMLFTVSDKKGRFVTDLKKEDFEVTEEKKPQQIVEFVAESDLPLRLAVLIDTSNSIRDRFRFQQEAAVEFINSVMRPQDKAVVISFDTGPELVADLTSNTGDLAKAVRSLRPGGGTVVLRRNLLRLPRQVAGGPASAQVPAALIVLSDGDDNQSRMSRDQALEMAHKADVVFTRFRRTTPAPSRTGTRF
jgi:VWFA-related protein